MSLIVFKTILKHKEEWPKDLTASCWYWSRSIMGKDVSHANILLPPHWRDHYVSFINASLACKTHFLAYSLISSVPSVCTCLNRTVYGPVNPGSCNPRPLVRQRPQRKVHNIVVHKPSCCFTNLLKPTTFFRSRCRRHHLVRILYPLRQELSVRTQELRKVIVSRGSALEACAIDETRIWIQLVNFV